MKYCTLILVLLSITSCNHLDVEAELTKGLSQYNNGQLEESILSFTKIIEETDTCISCYEYRSNAARFLKRYEESLKDLNSLIEMKPNQPHLYANRASIFYHKANYTSALLDFKKALDLKPDFVEMLNPISHMLFVTGEKDQACDYYKLALAVGNSDFNEEIVSYCADKLSQ